MEKESNDEFIHQYLSQNGDNSPKQPSPIMDPQRNDLFTLDDDDSRNALDSYSRIEQNL